MPGTKYIGVEVRGFERVMRALARAEESGFEIAEEVLVAEAHRILTKAKRITPVRWGILKGSGHVTMPRRTRTTVLVMIVFGGAAREYAIYVHENLHAYHKPPTQAKFLEQPALEALRTMRSRLGRHAWAKFRERMNATA